MKIEIPFSEEIYKEQSDLVFSNLWKNELKNNYLKLFWGLLSLILGLIVLYNGRETGYILIGISIHYFIIFYNYYDYYKNSKLSYYKEMEEFIAHSNKLNEVSIWVFEEHYFKNAYDGWEAKYNWRHLKRYEIIGKNLLVYLINKDTSPFMLSELEVGPENFQKIIEILDKKLEK